MCHPVTVKSHVHRLKKGRAVTWAPLFRVVLLCMLVACSARDVPEDNLEPLNLTVITTTKSKSDTQSDPTAIGSQPTKSNNSIGEHTQSDRPQLGGADTSLLSEDSTLNTSESSKNKAAKIGTAVSLSELQFRTTPTIGLLLPLSGANQRIGLSMWNAAQMAVFEANNPNLSIRPYDTQGDPEQAQKTAHLAISEGVNIFVGPLFSDSTRSVANIAKQNEIPMITFSNDQNLAEPHEPINTPHLYIFGQLPSEQIVRVVDHVAPKTQGQFALISPKTPFGNTAAKTLRKALLSHEGHLVGSARYREGDLTSLETSVRTLIDADRFEEEHRVYLELFRARLRYAIAQEKNGHDVAVQEFDGLELEQLQAMSSKLKPHFKIQKHKQVTQTDSDSENEALPPTEDTHPALEIELVPILKTFERYIETDPQLSLDSSFLDVLTVQLTADANRSKAETLFNVPASKDNKSHTTTSHKADLDTKYTEPKTVEEYRTAFLRLRAASPYYKIDFDALLIAEDPQITQRMVPILRTYDLNRKPVAIMGTGLWDGADLGRKAKTLRGAIYASPEARFRAHFEDRYRAAFKTNPLRLTTLSYDAVTLVGLLTRSQTHSSSFHEQMTSKNGFSGLDGLFRFQINGLVERRIALHALTQNASEIIDTSSLQFDDILDLQ